MLAGEAASLTVHGGRDVGSAHAEDTVVSGPEEPAFGQEDALHEAVLETILRPDAGELPVAKPGQPVTRPDPERPLVVEQQGLDTVVGQAVASRPGPEAVPLEEREPGRRPRPDAPSSRRQETEKPVGREAVADAEASADSATKLNDASGENPDPDRPVLIFREGSDVAGVGGRRRERHARKGAVPANGEAVRVRANPEAPIPCRQEGRRLVGREPVARPVDPGPVSRNPVEASAGHGGPDRSRGVLRHRADVVAGEPLAPPDIDEEAVAQAQQPLGPGADPDASLVVLVEAPDVVGWKVSRDRRTAGDLLSRNPADTAAPRPDPEAPFAIDEEGRDLVRREAGSLFRRDVPVDDPREASAGRPDPDAPAGMRRQRHDGAVRQPVPGRESSGPVLLQARDAAFGGSGPDDPGTVDAECAYREAAAAGGVDALESGALLAEEPFVVRSDPEHATSVACERLDLPARQAFPGAERLEPRAPHPEEPASVRPDPEGAVLIREEREDGVRGELRCRPAVEEGKPGAVETGEPLMRPDPEVAVGSLGHRLDGVLRETLPRLPDVERCMGQREGGVERESGGRRGEKGQEDEEDRRRRRTQGERASAGRVVPGRALRPREHQPMIRRRGPGWGRTADARAREPVSRRGACEPLRVRSPCSAGSPAPGSG